ncbi:MAG: GntR family transcriptional regulator [Glaciihabitans sp.]|nr:GntR family transcriptional regulator [Glaciihabitans sp.]
MSAVDTAFHGLRQMVSSGLLGPGDKFPAEADLCEQLGVSRGPLREAVRMLSALGAVESRHGSGVYVSQLRPEDLVGSLALTVDLLPLSGLVDMYELRRVLESHAAAQAAARVDEATLERMHNLLDRIEATQDTKVASALDAEFHSLITSAAGNPTLAALTDVFRSRSRAYPLLDVPNGAEMKRISDQGHRSIAVAIGHHDPVAASSAAAAHVTQTELWLREYQPSVAENRIGD